MSVGLTIIAVVALIVVAVLGAFGVLSGETLAVLITGLAVAPLAAHAGAAASERKNGNA